MAAFLDKRPWLGCCVSGLIDRAADALSAIGTLAPGNGLVGNKSRLVASVYQCFPFIWQYNALVVDWWTRFCGGWERYVALLVHNLNLWVCLIILM